MANQKHPISFRAGNSRRTSDISQKKMKIDGSLKFSFTENIHQDYHL